MPPVRLTGFFRDDDGHGWSEQHDIDGGVTITTLTPFLLNFDGLMKSTRRPMLAGDGYYIGCRAAYKTDDGRIAASNLLAEVPVVGTKTVAGQEVWMNESSDAIKVRLQNAASTANSDIYLRGVWDAVMVGGQVFFGGDQGTAFKRLLTAYVDALRQGAYGWMGVNPNLTPRGKVTSYEQTAEGTIRFTVAATNGKPMPANGSKVQVKFSRINGSASILNRTIVCVVESPTSLLSVPIIGATAFETEGTFSIPVKGFIPYDHFSYVKLGTRKTGRPFGVQRGRLSAMVLH